jgi:hypothetical protein
MLPLWAVRGPRSQQPPREATSEKSQSKRYEDVELVGETPVRKREGGAVESALLADVLNATTVVATTAGNSLSISRLPTGYVERVAPQLHAEDVPFRRTLTNAAGDVSLNEISDWIVPELAAAASGADYRLVDVNGLEGWTGRTEFNSYGPLTFLVWSPQPGVVFEIVTTNDERSTEELVELATATSVISATEWDRAFGQ